MRYLMFILFTIIHLAMVLKIPEGAMKFKYLKYMAIAIPVVFAIAALSALVIKATGHVPSAHFKNTFFSVVLSVLTVLLLNCMIIIGAYMVDRVLGFHQAHNAGNLNRFPVNFVMKYHINIKTGIKMFFFLGAVLMFYGTWLGRKPGSSPLFVVGRVEGKIAQKNCP